MGNKTSKKKLEGDEVDGAPTKNGNKFDKIITRLHLRPNKWKSDSHLEQKQVNRYEVTRKDSRNGSLKHTIFKVKPFSKSTDWTEVSLEVPDNKNEAEVKETSVEKPVPPPRKKKGIKERIEAAAKNSFQAFQMRKPVEEELCIKKTINYICPCGDPNHRHGHHHPSNNTKDKKANEKRSASVSKATAKQLDKEEKRKKNLSVISLPNYSELKLSVPKTHDDLEKRNSNNSATSLPTDGKKVSPKKDYMTRCRSFGSILPNQILDKLKTAKNPADIESDDSCGALEDWDLRLLEHYNPKDSSLPRVRKPVKSEKDVLDGLEGMIISEEEATAPAAPKPPVRRSESLLKKITRNAVEKSQQIRKKSKEERARPGSTTPPPSPVTEVNKEVETPKKTPIKLPEVDENGRVEHSSLMKILEKYSMEEKLLKDDESIPYIDENGESLKNFDSLNHTPTHNNNSETINKQEQEKEQKMEVEFKTVTLKPKPKPELSVNNNTKIISHPVEDFLNAERMFVIQQQAPGKLIKT